MLNMFRMLVHPSSGACDLFAELFHGLYCSGSMRVGVTVWFGWGGVVSLCRLKHCVERTGLTGAPMILVEMQSVATRWVS